VRRREFIALLGGAAIAGPPAGHAQPAMPAIGFLYGQSVDQNADRLRAFRQGLKETGYVESENLAIEYRWADNQVDRLPVLAADLVRRQVAVIIAVGGNAAISAARAATSSIPIVFGVGEDPIRLGFVTSLARPSNNLTGVYFLATDLAAKRMEVLRELVPGATRFAVLISPTTGGADTANDIEVAARSMGVQVQFHDASSSRDIDEIFASFMRQRPDALFVAGSPFFRGRRVQLATLAARHAIPAAYAARDYVEIGGLMSYGANINDSYRQMGDYAGRLLKGAKPADLPVVQSGRFELVINLQIARLLSLTVPPTLLARADEVIE
jgi:putative ABC transport system substrate-binding protein